MTGSSQYFSNGFILKTKQTIIFAPAISLHYFFNSLPANHVTEIVNFDENRKRICTDVSLKQEISLRRCVFV